MAEQDYIMSLIIDWAVQVWVLLQTLGWWIIAGLALCSAMQILPPKGQGERSKVSAVLLALVYGVLLPVCNFAAIPLAVVLWSCGMGMDICFAFLSAATLMNPAGILSAWAYMGPSMTIAYILSALTVSMTAAITGRCVRADKETILSAVNRKNRILLIWKKIAPELAFWTVLGIASEALLIVLMPKDLWSWVLLDPQEASFGQTAAVGLFRHVCIPDDIALAASLTATGFRPGCAVLLLLLGVSTNLPELFVLYGMAGKKTAVIYLGITTVASVVVALLTEVIIGTGFVPHFNLADAEIYTRIANLLSIRTWMPAKVPCACILLFLAGLGLWHRNDHLSFGPIQHGRTENKRKN